MPIAYSSNTEIPRDERCAAVARQFIHDQLEDVASKEWRENALLVTSELITNAYHHGSGAIELRVALLDGETLIEVIDGGTSGAVRIREQGATDGGGWGLRIVDRLAREWGVGEGTTHVWARLPLE